MVKVVKIIKDDAIMGVQYGTVDVPETTTKIERAKSAYDSAVAKVQATRAKKIRSEKTKNK